MEPERLRLDWGRREKLAACGNIVLLRIFAHSNIVNPKLQKRQKDKNAYFFVFCKESLNKTITTILFPNSPLQLYLWLLGMQKVNKFPEWPFCFIVFITAKCLQSLINSATALAPIATFSHSWFLIFQIRLGCCTNQSHFYAGKVRAKYQGLRGQIREPTIIFYTDTRKISKNTTYLT